MFDDFQDEDEDTSAFLDDLIGDLTEEEDVDSEADEEIEEEEPYVPPPPGKRRFGMTAFQRFVVSMLFFGSVLIIGLFAVVILEAVALPF